MPHSNRTSFLTAEQDSPRNSRKEHNTATNYLSSDEESRQTAIERPSSGELSDDVGSSHTVIAESICNNDLEKNTTRYTTTPDLKTYPVAWLLLFFIVCLRAAVSIFGNTFSPIPQVTADFMGISLSSINWLYNIMSICYIVASFFTSYLYKKIGIKWSVSIQPYIQINHSTNNGKKLFLSGVLLSLGCWIRWVAVRINPPSFPVLMLGQTLASFSSPVNLNLMTLVSKRKALNMHFAYKHFISSLLYGSQKIDEQQLACLLVCSCFLITEQVLVLYTDIYSIYI